MKILCLYHSNCYDGLDVAKIAEGYGGGGHKNASSFRMPLGWRGDK
jgi:nanoRNase/pAp phosphatase (c-di-AMP/oligoRNAs hydrolase)